MNTIADNPINKNHENDIDIKEIFHILFQGKWIIVFLTASASIIGLVYSLYLPNIYQSEALLAPVDSSKNTSSALGGYASLAGLAGIQFPSMGGESNSTKAIEKLNSLSFFENNILPNIFLPDLMAIESWDSQANKVIYDDSTYKKDTNSWVRDYSHPNKQIPTAQESFEVFKEHLDISLNQKSGFLTLKIKHQSPYLAKQWAELLINQVNIFYRLKDKSESEKAVSYLNQQIKLTSLSEVKEAIAQLLQNETKKLALIEANQSYVFEYIDPPAVMEKKSEPSRAMILILSALLGGVISILLVFMRHFAFT